MVKESLYLRPDGIHWSDNALKTIATQFERNLVPLQRYDLNALDINPPQIDNDKLIPLSHLCDFSEFLRHEVTWTDSRWFDGLSQTEEWKTIENVARRRELELHEEWSWITRPAAQVSILWKLSEWNDVSKSVKMRWASLRLNWFVSEQSTQIMWSEGPIGIQTGIREWELLSHMTYYGSSGLLHSKTEIVQSFHSNLFTDLKWFNLSKFNCYLFLNLRFNC